ncbi:class I-like SAM-binding methyltransferase super [Ancistrocladus abbreviatus]
MHDYEGQKELWMTENILPADITLEQSLPRASHRDRRTAAVVKEIDCLTVTISDILNVRAQVSSSVMEENQRFRGFGGWIDVHFRERNENSAKEEVELTSAPSTGSGTHWGQQFRVFLLRPRIQTNKGDHLNVSFAMDRSISYWTLSLAGRSNKLMAESYETVSCIPELNTVAAECVFRDGLNFAFFPSSELKFEDSASCNALQFHVPVNVEGQARVLMLPEISFPQATI